MIKIATLAAFNCAGLEQLLQRGMRRTEFHSAFVTYTSRVLKALMDVKRCWVTNGPKINSRNFFSLLWLWTIHIIHYTRRLTFKFWLGRNDAKNILLDIATLADTSHLILSYRLGCLGVKSQFVTPLFKISRKWTNLYPTIILSISCSLFSIFPSFYGWDHSHISSVKIME